MPSPQIPIEVYYEWIGRISSLWSWLENTVDETIWQLASVDDDPGACITAQLSGIRPRLNALRALVWLRGKDKELNGEIKAFETKAISAGARRNRSVHDAVLHMNPDTEEARVVRWRMIAEGRLHMNVNDADIKDYRKAALEIADVFTEYQNLERKIFSKFPTYSRRPR